jgi:hypothetical protein
MAAWSSWSEAEHYCRVVICKNRKFHDHQNISSGHKIPLAETDALASPPVLDLRFRVRCDECGEEYFYHPADLVRFQMVLGREFQPHPLFADASR